MLVKVTSFHVYSHQDNKVDTIENCSICELAVQNQNAEYTLEYLKRFSGTLLLVAPHPSKPNTLSEF